MELAEIRPFEPQMAEIDLFSMPDAVNVGEPSVRKVKPYIAGHVTDGSSTFTFKVNNADVTVPVDANGNWKWYVDRTITDFQDSFKQKNNIEKLFIYDKLNDCTSLYGMFTDASALQEVEFRNAIFNKVTTTAYMLNRAYAITKLKLPNAQFDSLTTVSNMFIDATNLETIEIKSFKISLNLRWQSKLTEQSVLNIINAVAADGITLTFHATVYAMIQAQLEIEDSPIYNAYWDSDYDFTIASA